MWRVHRTNIRASERRRFGFKKSGTFDEWLLESVKELVIKNHGVVLYPNRLSSSEFKSTAETFHIVPLQDFDVHAALKERSEEIEFPKLSQDLEFLKASTASPAPYLPFTTVEEKKQWAKYVNSQTKVDIDRAAIHWNRKVVDGVKLMPKLKCHIREYIKRWDRSQRAKQSFDRSSVGRESLRRLNAILPTGIRGED
jgi:hypothetical protein